jgi:biopolymer transport protein ExbD
MAGAVRAHRGRRSRTISDINITPLCDILLVLLIIFMVASTYIVSQTMKVELPKASSSDGPAKTPLALTLESDGTIRWNKRVVTEPVLLQELHSTGEADHDAELVLSADERVPHGRVVHFMDVAKLAGITRFAINVEQRK